MQKIYKSAMRFFAKNPHTNAFVHVLGGIGIGFLLAYPVAGAHPVRWGLLFLGLSIAGHVWAGYRK